MQQEMPPKNMSNNVDAPEVSKSENKPISMHLVYIAVIIGMIIGSFATTLMKVILNMGVASECITFYRMFIVTLCIAPICLSKRTYRLEIRSAFSNRRSAIFMLLLGVCKLLGVLFASFGIRYVPILVYSTLWNLNPVFVIILAYLFLHERTRGRALAGVFICMAGVFIVGCEAIWGSLLLGQSHNVIFGIGIAVLSSFSYAVYMIIIRMMRQGFSLPTMIFVQFFIATLIDFVICKINGVSMHLPTDALLIMLVLSLFCTLLSQSLPVWALKYVSPSLYSLINLMGIIFCALNAYLLLGEVPNLLTVVGAILLIIGLFIYTRAKHQTAT